MSSVQKIIKIFATIFAIFLAVSIISGILGGVFFALRITEGTSRLTNRTSAYLEEHQMTATYDYSQSYSGIEYLEIDGSINNIIICSGDEFNVTMKNVSTGCKVEAQGNVLQINDTNHNGTTFLSWIFDFLDGSTPLQIGSITVTVPKEAVLKDCNIDNGTGTLRLEDFQTKTMEINAGTGTISLKNITADYIDLDSGTGSIDCKNAMFNGSNISAGTGTISISGKLLGNHYIDCGVGTLNLKLEDPMESYSLDLEKGLGSVKINGRSYSNFVSSASTGNSLTISGGVGSINIDFSEPF